MHAHSIFMCFSSFASFSVGAGLIGAGAVCICAAFKKDKKYLPLAAMPLIAGLQQIVEGMVWKGFESGQVQTAYTYAFLYVAFVWLFWPSWTGFSAGALEPQFVRRRVFYLFGAAGLVLGLSLYVPYLFHPEWLKVEVIRHSIAYSNSCLLPDYVMPRNATYALYMFFICAPLFLSSHASLRFFGATLLIFVPLTMAFFLYAYASVLCFFAALASIHILYIVAGDRCRDPSERFNRIANEFTF